MPKRAKQSEKKPNAISSEWREDLKKIQKQLHGAMQKLIHDKNYSGAEQALRIVDKLMLDLIEEAGGAVVRFN